MDIRKFITVAFIAILSASGCAIDSPQNTGGADETFEFTLSIAERSFNSVKITVKHDGSDNATWYGFVTEDAFKEDYDLFSSEYSRLKKAGKVTGLKKATQRSITLEDLKPNTNYKYIVFAITEDCKLYRNVPIKSISFKTIDNVFLLEETEDWTIRREDERQEGMDIITIETASTKPYRFTYVDKEVIDAFNNEFKDGYDVYDTDGNFMTTVDGIGMFVLDEIYNVQNYVVNQNGKLEDVTYIGSGSYKLPRLIHGGYYLIVIGFESNGQHTQTYRSQLIEVPEETAEAGYEKWFGTYEFTGMADVTDENGTVTEESRTYRITIGHYDNNYVYRVRGWECGPAVGEGHDWEKDIMGYKEGDGNFLAFPGYYNNGKLELREVDMTSITFDGKTEYTLGLYGYFYDSTKKDNVPVIVPGTPMAAAEPIAEGQDETLLNALSAVLTDINGKETTIEYNRLGYIFHLEGYAAGPINPPLKLPVTIKKISDQTSPAAEPSSIMKRRQINRNVKLLEIE